MSNQRQIAVPFATYASDFSDWFPAVGSWQTTSWHKTFGLLGYVSAGATHPLYPTEPRWSIYRCLSEVGSNFRQDGVWHNSSFEEGVTNYMAQRRGTSYRMNRSHCPIYNVPGTSLDAFGPASSWEEYCFVNYQYVFRHGGQRMGWVFQGSTIEVGSANVLFLDGHVSNRSHSVISGTKIYTPMFQGN